MSLIVQYSGYLIVAIVIGMVVGWLFWGGEPFEATSAIAGGVDDERAAELSAQVEAREQEIARLRKRLKRVHADLDVRDTHVAAAKVAHEEVSEVLRQREAELELLRHQPFVGASGAGDNGQQEALLRRLSELEEDLAASRTQVSQLNASLDDVQLHRDRVVAEHSSLSEQHESLARRFTSLEQSALSSEGSSVTSEAHDELARQFAESQERLTALENEREAVEAARAEAETLRNEETQRAAEWEAAYERIASELAENQGGSDEVTARIVAAEREKDELLQRLMDAEKLVAERDESVLVLRDELGTAKSLSASLDSGPAEELRLELSKVQTELARSRQSVTTLRQRIEEIEDENDRLAGDLAKSNTELTSRTGRTQDLVTENERLTAELNRLRTGVLGLDERAKKAESELFRVQSESGDVQRSLDQLSVEASSLRSELATTQQQLTAANQQVSSASAQVSAAKQEAQNKLSAVNIELSDARLRADAAHQALQELTQDFVDFREATMRQQNSMQALSERLDRARTSLVGRAAPSNGALDEDEHRVDDLSKLPNMTPVLLANLSELGVSSYGEIAQWSTSDMQRIEAALGEPNGSLAQRGWVQSAAVLAQNVPQG